MDKVSDTWPYDLQIGDSVTTRLGSMGNGGTGGTGVITGIRQSVQGLPLYRVPHPDWNDRWFYRGELTLIARHHQ